MSRNITRYAAAGRARIIPAYDLSCKELKQLIAAASAGHSERSFQCHFGRVLCGI